jgi:dTDP-4-amino-4,6-dideoxy-D-galactose acyltransferase
LSAGPAPGRILDWDSEFFGLRIARSELAALDAGACARIRAWAEREAVDCVYWLGAADDAASSISAQRAGFLLVDVRVTLRRALGSAPARMPAGVRPSRPEDLASLKAIARVSHRDSRFYADPGFERQRCDALYERWIERSCAQTGAAVIVADGPEAALGYIACHVEPDGAGQIGLVAVAPAARGRGLGATLVEAALAWFGEQGCPAAQVVTQGRNRDAMRMYERCGFLCERVQNWFHLWPSTAAPGGTR